LFGLYIPSILGGIGKFNILGSIGTGQKNK